MLSGTHTHDQIIQSERKFTVKEIHNMWNEYGVLYHLIFLHQLSRWKDVIKTGCVCVCILTSMPVCTCFNAKYALYSDNNLCCPKYHLEFVRIPIDKGRGGGLWWVPVFTMMKYFLYYSLKELKRWCYLPGHI